MIQYSRTAMMLHQHWQAKTGISPVFVPHSRNYAEACRELAENAELYLWCFITQRRKDAKGLRMC